MCLGRCESEFKNANGTIECGTEMSIRALSLNIWQGREVLKVKRCETITVLSRRCSD
jgi:hypothetical protein